MTKTQKNQIIKLELQPDFFQNPLRWLRWARGYVFGATMEYSPKAMFFPNRKFLGFSKMGWPWDVDKNAVGWWKRRRLVQRPEFQPIKNSSED